MADEAVNKGKAAIQSALDFFAWTQSPSCNLQNVSFLYVAKEECEEKAYIHAQRTLKPVTGTMKIHAVIGHGKCTVIRACQVLVPVNLGESSQLRSLGKRQMIPMI